MADELPILHPRHRQGKDRNRRTTVTVVAGVHRSAPWQAMPRSCHRREYTCHVARLRRATGLAPTSGRNGIPNYRLRRVRRESALAYLSCAMIETGSQGSGSEEEGHEKPGRTIAAAQPARARRTRKTPLAESTRVQAARDGAPQSGSDVDEPQSQVACSPVPKNQRQ